MELESAYWEIVFIMPFGLAEFIDSCQQGAALFRQRKQVMMLNLDSSKRPRCIRRLILTPNSVKHLT